MADGRSGEGRGSKAGAGEAARLASMLREAYPVVRGYLVRVSLDRVLADDLTQATMERAIEQFDTWDGRGRFSTWLVGIASNLFLDTMRRRRRTERLEPPVHAEELVARAPDPASREALRRLALLPPELAVVVVLKHAYGHTYEEIAAITGWPEGTVKSRVSHALAALREELDHA